MEKVYFLNIFSDSVIFYGSFEEAERKFFEILKVLTPSGRECLVVADALEINFPKEKCQTEHALLTHAEIDWAIYLEGDINETVGFLRRDDKETFGNTKVFELHNIKKFKPVLDVE